MILEFSQDFNKSQKNKSEYENSNVNKTLEFEWEVKADSSDEKKLWL